MLINRVRVSVLIEFRAGIKSPNILGWLFRGGMSCLSSSKSGKPSQRSPQNLPFRYSKDLKLFVLEMSDVDIQERCVGANYTSLNFYPQRVDL